MSTTEQNAIALRAQTKLAEVVDPESGLDYMTLATVMVQSGFFSGVQSVAQGVVKILAGKELGFPAIASLRHIYVHKGHIGIMATLVATKIRQSGRYDYKIQRCDDERCDIDFLRLVKGEWIVEGAASFTIEEATRAGLVKPDSGWAAYPPDLLFARALTRGQRRYCPEIFGQTIYTEEEVRAMQRNDPASGPNGDSAIPAPADDLMPRRKSEQPQTAETQEAPPPSAAREAGDGVAAQLTMTSSVAGKSAPTPPAAPDDEEARISALYGVQLITREEERSLDAAEEATKRATAAEVSPSEPQAETAPKEQMSLADELDAAGEARQRDGLLKTFEQAVKDRGVKAPFVAGWWATHAPGKGPDTCSVAEATALLKAVEKIPLLKQEEKKGNASAPGSLTFDLNGRPFTTAGATKDQMLRVFDLCNQVDKKGGKGLAAAMLLKEFKLHSRTGLTADTADQYVMRMREVVEN